MIIRDEEGNIYNIPDSELKKYLVVTPSTKRPEKLCLEPMFDAQLGPHDGWSYVEPSLMPKKKSTAAKKSAPAKKPSERTKK